MESIANFAAFVFSLNMKNKINENLLGEPGFKSVLQGLKNVLRYIYYDIYTVPNLKDNKVMVVKPETYFVSAPKCNIIFPCMKTSISASRNFKREPTRIMYITPPMYYNNDVKDASIATVAAVSSTKKANTVLETGITSIPADNVKGEKPLTWPLVQLSDYEKEYGVRLFNRTGGSDIIGYLGTKLEEGSLKDVGTYLQKLSRYELAKERYLNRSGDIQLYFNPYITPGFPFISLEDQNDQVKKETVVNKLNLYGYITSIVHSINSSGWTTTASYTAMHTDSDQTPEIVPIIDDYYDPNNATKTYADIFGKDVTPVAQTDAATKFKEYTKPTTTITEAYAVVKREATTLADYLKDICGLEKDKVYSEKEGYAKITGDYFNTDTQKIVEEYTKQVVKDKLAFSYTDIN